MRKLSGMETIDDIDEWFRQLPDDYKDLIRFNIDLIKSFQTSLKDYGFEPVDSIETYLGMRIPVFENTMPSMDSTPINLKNTRPETIVFYFNRMAPGGLIGISPRPIALLRPKDYEFHQKGEYRMIIEPMTESFVQWFYNSQPKVKENLAFNSGAVLSLLVDSGLSGDGMCYKKNWVLQEPGSKSPFLKSTLYTVSPKSKAEEMYYTLSRMEGNTQNIMNVFWQFGFMNAFISGLKKYADKETKKFVNQYYNIR